MLIKNIKIMQNLVQNFKFLQERKVLKKLLNENAFCFCHSPATTSLKYRLFFGKCPTHLRLSCKIYFTYLLYSGAPGSHRRKTNKQRVRRQDLL